MWGEILQEHKQNVLSNCSVESVVAGGLFLLWTVLGCEERWSEAADTVWVHLDTADCV